MHAPSNRALVRQRAVREMTITYYLFAPVRLQRRDTLGGHKFSDLVRNRPEYQRIRS